MKQIRVREEEAGQRLDRLLSRYLKEAPKSFLYKMMRKKNITLNGKKADGGEKVQAGDEIRVFLSDGTWEKFAGPVQAASAYPVTDLEILYEDAHILLVNKPAGMLAQKAKPEDVSLNEYVLGYLEQKGRWKEGAGDGTSPEPDCVNREGASLEAARVNGEGASSETEKAVRVNYTFRPSVCNRLDRNTSGIVICGTSVAGLRKMSELLRDRNVHKYYQCLAAGRLTEEQRIRGYLQKDPGTNRVRVLAEEQKGAAPIETAYRPLRVFADCTLLEVLLVTGRSHQIRAHLASVGHPIIGDYKYGDPKTNRDYRRRYGLSCQLLHAGRLEFPVMDGLFSHLSGRVFTAEPPARMQEILKDAEKRT